MKKILAATLIFGFGLLVGFARAASANWIIQSQHTLTGADAVDHFEALVGPEVKEYKSAHGKTIRWSESTNANGVNTDTSCVLEDQTCVITEEVFEPNEL